MKRKLPVLIIAVVLILCFTATAMAASPDQPAQAGALESTAPGASASPTSAPPAPEPSDVVRVNPDYFDAGKMNASYAQGYSPILQDSQAIIVVPLIVDTAKLQAGSVLNHHYIPWVGRSFCGKQL
jgi:hypothetical protein